MGVVLAALMAGACSDNDSGDSSAGGAATTVAGAAADGQLAGGQGAPAPAQVAERQVVATAAVRVRVKSVETAAREAVLAVEKAGGYVGQQQVDLEQDPKADIEFRVPPGNLTATLDGLAALGTVIDRSSKTEEVTAKVIDLEGRLKTWQTSADRLRTLVKEGRTTADIVALENELAKRETEIESLQGQLRVLRDQIGLATVKAHLTQVAPPPVKKEAEGRDWLGFLDGLKAGWTALLNTLAFLLTVLGAMLPFSPVIAVLVWLGLRRRRAIGEVLAP